MLSFNFNKNKQIGVKEVGLGEKVSGAGSEAQQRGAKGMKKRRIFRKKEQDISTGKGRSEKPVVVPDDSVPGVKEGYFVDRFYSYGEPVDFVNEKMGIRTPIIRDHAFLNFPGVEDVDRFIQYLLDISEEFSVNYSLKQENN